MPHGYDVIADTDSKIVYEKTHNNDEETVLELFRKRGEWLIEVDDPNGLETIDTAQTRREARRIADKWMENHPRGIEPESDPGARDPAKNIADGLFSGGRYH